MIKLTKKQEVILELIQEYITNNGMPPTRAEIANELGFKSANAAEEHLRALAKKGFIEMIPGASRGIKLSAKASKDENINLGIPLVGVVAAGTPLLAIEHIEEHLKIDPSLFHPAANFLLRVKGDSMIDIGIKDGDLLAVHSCSTANNGEVVVARVEDEVTVKRFEKKGNRIYLHAENKNYKPIIVDLEYQQFAIEGQAVGVIRNGDLK